MSIFKRLAGLVGGHRRLMAVGVLAMVASTILSLVYPQILRRVIDQAILRSDARALVSGIALLAGVTLLQGGTGFASSFLAAKASHGAAYDVRNAVFSKLQRLGVAYHERTQVGQLVTRMTSDVDQLREFVGDGLIQLASAGLTLAGAVVVLFWMAPVLAIVALMAVPAAAAALLLLVGRLGPIYRARQEKLAKLSNFLQENLRGARVVRVFGRSPYEIARGRAANEELRVAALRERRAIANSFPVLNNISLIGPIVVTVVGCVQIVHGLLTVGELVAFHAYMLLVLGPVSSLGISAQEFAQASASGTRVFEVLDAQEEVVDKGPDAIQLTDVEGRIEFDDVCFRYPGDTTDTLSHLSYVIEPNSRVAIVGATGSGKTSVVNLIARFHDVSSGAVRVDGVDVRDASLDSLRGNVGFAMQDAMLFSGSIRDNIAFGRPDATPEEVSEVAGIAQIDDFINELPDGYDTLIAERGIGLSGGQSQRLNIARALLIKPRILILDDSTSQIDATTETAIQRGMDELMRRCTSVSIASQLASVLQADAVLVMDRGHLVDAGTHKELLQRCPLYVEIAHSELLADTDNSVRGADASADREAFANGGALDE